MLDDQIYASGTICSDKKFSPEQLKQHLKKILKREEITEWKLSNCSVARHKYLYKYFNKFSTKWNRSGKMPRSRKMVIDSSFNVQGLELITMKIWVVLIEMINWNSTTAFMLVGRNAMYTFPTLAIDVAIKNVYILHCLLSNHHFTT